MKRVCIIGLGYIGLPTAVTLANYGHQVLGVDINRNVVTAINSKVPHIVEPGLQELLTNSINSGRLRADEKIDISDVYIICVPTPFKDLDEKRTPQPDISFIIAAAESLAPYLKDGDIVILESTSPVGTTSKLELFFSQKGINTKKIYIGYCPERVMPGNIFREITENSRIVGGITQDATAKITEFYRSFTKGEILMCNASTAEMTKLAENSFRDLNIAFANELSILCENQGINPWEVIKLANKHPRVDILQPGIGVGGHCIAVDPWFIVSADEENSKLIRTSREVNNYKTQWIINLIKSKLSRDGNLSKKKSSIGFLGVTFKPNIDDVRGSPAMNIVQHFIHAKYDVVVVEPHLNQLSDCKLVSIEHAIEHCDNLFILVRHDAFTDKITLEKLKLLGAIDLCGAYIN